MVTCTHPPVPLSSRLCTKPENLGARGKKSEKLGIIEKGNNEKDKEMGGGTPTLDKQKEKKGSTEKRVQSENRYRERGRNLVKELASKFGETKDDRRAREMEEKLKVKRKREKLERGKKVMERRGIIEKYF